MPEFTLRPMEPADGPAIDALMRHEAQTTKTVSMTTHYRYDVHEALLAQHPSLFGVVAVRAAGDPAIAGIATAFLDEVMIGGQAHPAALPRQPQGPRRRASAGAGSPPRGMADRRSRAAVRWRGRDHGRRSKPSNTASLATANHWATPAPRSRPDRHRQHRRPGACARPRDISRSDRWSRPT